MTGPAERNCRSGITRILRAVLLAALSVSGTAIAAAADPVTIEGPARVVDGDGLKIGPVAIRLHGIDAPEVGQTCPKRSGGSWACGTEATNRLHDLAGGRDVSCEAIDRDGYGRIVARCRVNGVDVAAKMVEAGLAWAYVEYSTDYVALETAAKAEARGVWQGDAQAPWAYRADRWARAVAEAPGGCPIKGNISADDAHIYHTPWSPWYARTKITEAKGERWFCDEAEAQAAGWRAAEGR